MKKLFIAYFVCAVCILFYSCSNDDNEPFVDPGDSVKEEIKGTASLTEMNLYEMSKLSISEYPTNFDSIKWEVPGIFEKMSVPSNGILSIGQSFALPGNYNFILTGYKENKVSASDTVKIRVKGLKDFLSIEWNNPSKEYFNFISRQENYVLDLKYVENENPYALLDYGVWNVSEHEDGAKHAYAAARGILKEYITDIYGEPQYLYEGEDISDSPLITEYTSRFKTSLDGIDKYLTPYIPLAIWETTKSYISLIGFANIDEYNYYMVIAEPRD